MQTIRVAERLRAQIHQFSGIIFPHFSKPQTRFIEQMLLGIDDSQDCKLSRIARALSEPIALKKTGERLSRHLATPQLGRQVQAQLVARAAQRIGPETLIVIDPTDLRKPYAQAMPYLATVRDGSTGQLAQGYWCGVALACEPASRQVTPCCNNSGRQRRQISLARTRNSCRWWTRLPARPAGAASTCWTGAATARSYICQCWRGVCASSCGWSATAICSCGDGCGAPATWRAACRCAGTKRWCAVWVWSRCSC